MPISVGSLAAPPPHSMRLTPAGHWFILPAMVMKAVDRIEIT
jgi:hypothetical protein